VAAISNDPSAPGIAELVRGVASFRHVITRDRVSRTHIVAAGRAPADITSVMTSERLAIGMDALARTYDHVVVDAGALPQIPLDRFARFAPHAVLVAPGLPDTALSAARDRLIAAGFADVTTFVDVPPLPDSGTSRPSIAAA
jgi:Mrp family chromosome partitioning ATPase